MTRVFSEVGLADAMRCDNGPPFGSAAAGGLCRLSVWLLKLGIEPRFISPASPQNNGRHERRHRTLQDETTRPPARPRIEQQRFDAFRRCYHEQRPHAALGQTTPASHWTPPRRQLPTPIIPATMPTISYDGAHRRDHHMARRTWRGEPAVIGQALTGDVVAIAEVEGGGYLVHCCDRRLGLIDAEGLFHRFAPPGWRRRSPVRQAGGTGMVPAHCDTFSRFQLKAR